MRLSRGVSEITSSDADEVKVAHMRRKIPSSSKLLAPTDLRANRENSTHRLEISLVARSNLNYKPIGQLNSASYVVTVDVTNDHPFPDKS